MPEYFDLEIRIEGHPTDRKAEYSLSMRSPLRTSEIRLATPHPLRPVVDALVLLRRHKLVFGDIKRLGAVLFQTFFVADVLDHLRESQRQADALGQQFRILLRIEAREIAEFPWEYLYDPDRNEFLAVKHPLIRLLALPERRPLPLTFPLRILVAVSSPPITWPSFDVKWKMTMVAEAYGDHRLIETVVLDSPTPTVLTTTLQKGRFNALHFIGYCSSDVKRCGLVLQEGVGGGFLSGEALGHALRVEDTLRLVILDAVPEEGNIFPSLLVTLAQDILQEGIPAVISMQAMMPDRAMKGFIRALFYSGLLEGSSIDAALTLARERAFEEGSEFEWGLPALFLRASDGEIFDFLRLTKLAGRAEKRPSGPPVAMAPAGNPSDASPARQPSPEEEPGRSEAIARLAGILLARAEQIAAEQIAALEGKSPPSSSRARVVAPPSPAPGSTGMQVLPLPVVPAQAPSAGSTLKVEVDHGEVALQLGDRTYRSHLRLDTEKLVAAVSPREYGEVLFEAVFNPDGLDGFDSSTRAGYDRAGDQAGNGRRIEIELRTLELQGHKWECLADPRKRSELPLAAVQSQPFYRRWGNARSALAAAPPLRILAAIASPATLGRELDDLGRKVNPRVAALSPIDIAQERDILAAGLQRLAGFAEYRVLDGPVTLETLREALQDGYHVLHLLAHGLLVDGSHYLVLEGRETPHRLLAARTFCETLQGSSLRLVVLAACQSAVPDAARSLRGLGASLLDAVPAVIAMQDEVRVDTAQLFTQHFYDRLARTGRVDQAMARTRAVLYQEGGGRQWQWGVPVLLMSTGDGRLFDVDEARVDRELPPLEPQVRSYRNLAGAGDPTPGKWERAFGAAARAYGLPLDVLPAPAAPAVEPETLTRPQERAELLALRQLALVADELGQEVAGECGLDLPSSVYAQIASALNAGKHIILIGPPGTGKTSLAHAVCNFAKEKGFATGAALTTATADWTAFDTVGGYVPTLQQTLQFRAGVFLEAIRTGRWLVIDEINRAEIDKAFGELFTVLAGQQVDLPYSVGSHRVRVLPPRGSGPEGWLPEGLLSGYDYVIHPNWRIVATMNVYDKSHLFTLSFAFMRRFAFIDIELPGREIYGRLIDGWLGVSGLPAEQAQPVREVLDRLLTPDNELTSCRELGPAIVKDMIAYMSHRHSESLPPLELLAEALLLYVTPQLDGIDSERIVGVCGFLTGLVGGTETGEGLLRRIRSLYPHLPPEAWR